MSTCRFCAYIFIVQREHVRWGKKTAEKHLRIEIALRALTMFCARPSHYYSSVTERSRDPWLKHASKTLFSRIFCRYQYNDGGSTRHNTNNIEGRTVSGLWQYLVFGFLPRGCRHEHLLYISSSERHLSSSPSHSIYKPCGVTNVPCRVAHRNIKNQKALQN